jgi:hypothetical protein
MPAAQLTQRIDIAAVQRAATVEPELAQFLKILGFAS